MYGMYSMSIFFANSIRERTETRRREERAINTEHRPYKQYWSQATAYVTHHYMHPWHNVQPDPTAGSTNRVYIYMIMDGARTKQSAHVTAVAAAALATWLVAAVDDDDGCAPVVAVITDGVVIVVVDATARVAMPCAAILMRQRAVRNSTHKIRSMVWSNDRNRIVQCNGAMTMSWCVKSSQK